MLIKGLNHFIHQWNGVRANRLSTCSVGKAKFRRSSVRMASHCPGREQLPPVLRKSEGFGRVYKQFSRLFVELVEQETYTFGSYKINKREVFLTTQLTYAFVNLRPAVPGHVLVSPKRLVKRFTELTAEETADLWLTAQKIGTKIENHFKASSLTFAIQDGPEAGQTVPHVHIHILPRKAGDFTNNDAIYDAIDDKEKKLREKLDFDKDRMDRTADEMAWEADELRTLF